MSQTKKLMEEVEGGTSLSLCDARIKEWKEAPFRAAEMLTLLSVDPAYSHRFFQFCYDRYKLKRWTVTRLIGLWKIFNILRPLGVVLQNESQARPFANLTDDEIADVGRRALRTAGSNENLTAKIIREAAKVYTLRKTETRCQLASKVDRARALEFLDRIQRAIESNDPANACRLLAEFKNGFVTTEEQEPYRDNSDDKTADTADLTAVGDASDCDVPSDNYDEANGQASAPVEASSQRLCAAEATPPRLVPIAVEIKGIVTPITRCNEVLVVVGDCLVDMRCEIPPLNFVRSTNTRRSSGERFKALKNGLYVECGDDLRAICRKSRQLLDEAGRKNVGFVVKMNDGSIKMY